MRTSIFRIERNAMILAILLALVMGIWGGWQAGLSVVLGALAAWIGLQWLKRSVDAMLGVAAEGGGTPRVGTFVATSVGRLVLILLVLFAMIRLSFVTLFGALIGLSVFVLAGIFEAFHLMFEGRV